MQIGVGITTQQYAIATGGALAAEFQQRITDGRFDAHRVNSGFSATDAIVFVGDLQSDVFDYHAGLLFENVTIPQGATILSAVLHLRASIQSGGIPTIRIRMELTANATNLRGLADFDARVRTVAEVPWTPEEWVNATIYQTPSFHPPFQEVINQGTWVEGNAIQIFLEDSTPGWSGTQERIAIVASEGDLATAPLLVVEYE